MAGHSHFANIKHKKAANDAKKQKVLSKISKEISIAIRDASNNPDDNPKLRLVLEKARAANIPKDNIERILNAHNKNKSDFLDLTYEGYGPNGVAMIVNCLTDSTNRTAADVRAAFSKHGGNLGVSGSVSYLFENKGIIVLDASLYSFDKIFEIVADAQVLDIKQEEDVIVIETAPKDLMIVKDYLVSKDIKEYLKVEVEKIAATKVDLNDEGYAKLEKLIDALEELDDVSDVFHNGQ